MEEKTLVKKSKWLSKHLRHAPESIGLNLENGGWVTIDDLLAAARRVHFGLSRAELDELQLLPFIYYLDHTTKRQMEQIWEILSTHEDSKLDSFLQELKQLAEHFSSAAQTPTKNSVPILSLNSLNDINVIWNAVERRTPKRKDSDDDGLNDSPLSDYNYTVSSSSNLDDNEELFPMDD